MVLEDESNRRNRGKSWWKQRTKMERRLIVIAIIAILIIIGLVIALAVVAAVGRKESSCLTETCVQEAYGIISRMNNTANPCDDFYEFVCGRYIAETEIPDDKSEIDPLSATGEQVNMQVRDLLSEEIKPGELRPFTLVKRLYQSCMNTSAIEQNGIEQMKEIFKKLGGWPIIDGNNWVEMSWIEINSKLRQYGFTTSLFIMLDSDINPKNSNEYIVTVDQAVCEDVADDNLKDGLSDNLVKSFADNLIDLAVLFGADRNFATKEVNDVFELRAKISQITLPKAEHTQYLLAANETTVGDMQRDYPSIPWINFINSSLAFPKSTISDKTKVLLVTPKYISQFEEIIRKTPKRAFANHALLQVLRTNIQLLPKSFRDRDQEFLASATGVTKPLPRWNVCVNKATTDLHIAADALYVRKYVNDQAKTDVTEMVSNIKQAFIKILKGVEWMDKNTKERAIEKAETITPHIAYPVELLDDKEVTDYYAQVKTDSDHPIEIVSEALKVKRDNVLAFYGSPVKKSHWTVRFAAITSNAVYDPQSNSVQIPLGIMQNVFYNKDRPQYMNYAGLGMVIGHEVTHGFDDVGKAFDKNGNAANWWEASTLQAYNSKAECFVDQYSNFTAPENDMQLNGKLTLGENIADNGGIKEAYLAYLEWITRNKEELPLPSVKYTPKQLFWISVAGSWCSKSRPSAVEQQILLDEHSPNRFRINGGVSNIHQFGEDFNCAVGTAMNPEKKCKLW